MYVLKYHIKYYYICTYIYLLYFGNYAAPKEIT